METTIIYLGYMGIMGLILYFVVIWVEPCCSILNLGP